MPGFWVNLSWNIRKFWYPRVLNIPFLKYKVFFRDFRFLNYNKLFNISARKFQFPKYKKIKKLIFIFGAIFEKRFIVVVWQCSEYASGSKYAATLNMSGFWIYQGSKYARVLNVPFPKYKKISFRKYRKVPFSEVQESSVSWNITFLFGFSFSKK